MKQALAWTETSVPRIDCPELMAHEQKLSGSSLSAVFVSHFLGNPASAFGHVMLYFGRDRSASLTGYSVSFEASIAGMSTIVYMRRGLLGGLRAAYHVAPLYERVGRYERQQQRDLWVFPLQLPQEEVDQLVQHLWELKDVTYAYGFFGENCAQKILALVHAVTPSHQLLPYSPLGVLPSEVVRRMVTQVGLAGPPVRRLSLVERYAREVSALTSAEKSQLAHMKETRTVSSEASSRTLWAALTWSEFKTPNRAFLRADGQENNRDYLWTRALWMSLAALGDTNPVPVSPVVSDARFSLLYSHQPARLRLRPGYRAAAGPVLGVGARWLLHDALDEEIGYPPRASVVVGQVEMGVGRTGRVFIDEATVLRVEQLAPASNHRSALAWRVDVGARRVPLRSALPLHVGAEASIGISTGLTQTRASVFVYSMAGVRLGMARVRDDRSFVPAVLWSSGVLTQLPGGVRVRAAIEYGVPLSSFPAAGSPLLATVVRKGLARNWDLEARFTGLRTVHELALGIVTFY